GQVVVVEDVAGPGHTPCPVASGRRGVGVDAEVLRVLRRPRTVGQVQELAFVRALRARRLLVGLIRPRVRPGCPGARPDGKEGEERGGDHAARAAPAQPVGSPPPVHALMAARPTRLEAAGLAAGPGSIAVTASWWWRQPASTRWAS